MLEKSTISKIRNTAGDAIVILRVALRKIKREARNVWGNQSVVKDLKDKINDKSDGLEHKIKKVKNEKVKK